jgi:NTP pyrophosphatase (non-canonical NTP hydrolase)
MIKYIFDTSDFINKFELTHRTSHEVLDSVMEEAGELATEVNIQSGHSTKEPGDDGIFGESVDVIINAVDMIRINYPDLTEQDIIDMVMKKCDKWITKKTKQFNDTVGWIHRQF